MKQLFPLHGCMYLCLFNMKIDVKVAYKMRNDVVHVFWIYSFEKGDGNIQVVSYNYMDMSSLQNFMGKLICHSITL